MQRFPNGIDEEGFFQKDAPGYFPKWIETARLTKENAWTRYILCNNAATLVYLANQGCITPHVWLSRKPKWDFPDRMVFDLDPQGNDFAAARAGAKALRQLLEEIGIRAMPMVPGSRGVHVLAPLNRRMNFEEVREFARAAARVLVKRNAEAYTIEARKEKRDGKLFIDTLRNGHAQTMVAPYAVRAKPEAPVATPFTWEELDSLKDARQFTIRTIFAMLEKRGDAWKESIQRTNSLGRARKMLNEMIAAVEVSSA